MAQKLKDLEMNENDTDKDNSEITSPMSPKIVNIQTFNDNSPLRPILRSPQAGNSRNK